jgi:PhnB protein
MSTPAVKPIPEGMHTLTPHIIVAGAAEAIEFYKKAFNAVEQVRLPGPGGKLMHAQLKIGDSTLMLVDEMPDCGNGASFGPKELKGTPVVLHLYVNDAQARRHARRNEIGDGADGARPSITSVAGA